MKNKESKLSTFWIALSVAIFITTEILIGSFLEKYVSGFMSISLRFLLMGLINLAAYFLGGFFIGMISKKRIWEPPIAASLCILLMYIITFFIPMTFYQYGFTKMLGASLIAFITTLIGSSMGENFVSKLRNSTNSVKNTYEFSEVKSQYYLGDNKEKNNTWSYENKKDNNFIS
ncbi:MAG: hypothetical protein HY819_24400 [Acidobacteria bacterium]|nr:hypothetical protein [Acidobacteriota bacterium]